MASEVHPNSLPQRDSREAPPCAGGGQGRPEKGTRELDQEGSPRLYTDKPCCHCWPDTQMSQV